MREHLKLFLTEEGYNIATAIDGAAALELLAQGTLRPDLVLADYSLPNGMSGVRASQKLRQELNRNLPFVILTGDISSNALRGIALHRAVETYASCEAFLDGFHSDKFACLLIDTYLPGMSGLELLEKLHHDCHSLPAIMITGNGDVAMALKAMKTGALDFIEKPIAGEELTASIDRALELWQDSRSGRDPPHGSNVTTPRGDGKGACRPPEQEHCRRRRHQPAHSREPSRLHHQKNRVVVAARVGQIGAHRRRRRVGTGRTPIRRSRDPPRLVPGAGAASSDAYEEECRSSRLTSASPNAPTGDTPSAANASKTALIFVAEYAFSPKLKVSIFGSLRPIDADRAKWSICR